MRRFLLLFALILHTFAMSAWYDFVENDIAYGDMGGNRVCVEYWYGYQSLTGAMNIPATVTHNGTTYDVVKIAEDAFMNCDGITSISIPGSVTDIFQRAFCGCTGLTSVTIPNSVSYLGIEVFRSCSGLTSVTLPAGLTSIPKKTFLCCTSLSAVNIPSGVTSIGPSAFESCASLTSVSLPSGVTSVEDGTFRNCSNLASVSLPDGLRSIGKDAFYRCSSLRSITIPAGVTTLSENCFCSCGLTTVIIPASVSSMGASAFSCATLREAYVKRCTPCTFAVESWVIPNVFPENILLKIPCGTIAAYSADANWQIYNMMESDFVVSLSASDELMGSVPELASYCMDDTDSLRAVAKTGYHFVSWQDGNTDNPRLVTFTQDTVFVAQFEINHYQLVLTVSDPAAGQVTGAGTYDYKTTATIEAISNNGYEFLMWSDAWTANPRRLTITEDTTLEAVFQRLPNALDDTEVPSTVDKIIRDGVLLIRRGGHLFDTLGRMQE